MMRYDITFCIYRFLFECHTSKKCIFKREKIQPVHFHRSSGFSYTFSTQQCHFPHHKYFIKLTEKEETGVVVLVVA